MLRHKFLSNTTLTVSKKISASEKLTLGDNGLISEPTPLQVKILIDHPDFEPTVSAEEIAEYIDGVTIPNTIEEVSDTNQQLNDTLKQLHLQLNEAKQKNESLQEEVDSLSAENNSLINENEHLKEKVAELESQKTGKDVSAETKQVDQNSGEPAEGSTKTEEGKAYIYKKDAGGKLRWMRDAENDPKN